MQPTAQPNTNRPPTVRAVIQVEDRTLLVQHHYMNPANLGKWSLPGGRIAPGDPDQESTLRRELREEFQVEIDIQRFIGMFPHEGQEHYFYLVLPQSRQFVLAPTEIAATGWFTFEEIQTLYAAGTLLGSFIFDAITASRDHTAAP